MMGHGAEVLRFWPGTAAVERHSHFGRSPATTERGYGVEIVLTFDDLEATFEAARSVGTILEPIRRRHWGLRDFRVLDPYGFYVRCTELHDPAAGSPHPARRAGSRARLRQDQHGDGGAGLRQAVAYSEYRRVVARNARQ